MGAFVCYAILELQERITTDMGFLSKKFAHYEALAESVCLAFLGRPTEFESGNGFRVFLSGKQTIAFYWRENHEDNWAELAVDPVPLSQDLGLPSSSTVVADWMEHRRAITGRQCAIHKREQPDRKRWPIVGFASSAELDDFLKSYRQLRATKAFSPTLSMESADSNDTFKSVAGELLGKYRERVASGEADTMRESIGRQRVGQDLLRDVVLEAWGNRCALTGIKHPALVVTSHIKAWKASTDEERLDPYNALPLAAHVDAAFDARLISFHDDGRIILSAALSESDLKALGICIYSRLSQPLSKGYLPYLAWHRSSMAS